MEKANKLAWIDFINYITTDTLRNASMIRKIRTIFIFHQEYFEYFPTMN